MRKAIVFKSALLPYSETFIREQILACKGWQIILVGRREVAGVTLESLDTRFLEARHAGKIRSALYALRRGLGVPYFGGLRELRKERPLLIHAHFGPEGVLAAPIARSLGIPLLVTLHGFDINTRREHWESGAGGWRMRSYPANLLALAQSSNTYFIAVSDAIRRRAIEFGIPANKVTTLYIGVDIQKFRPGGLPIAERHRRVLFVGRLVEKKGCEFLIRAMMEVNREVPDATLAIVGDGPLRGHLEDLSRACSIRVAYLGALNPEQVLDELNNARVLCLPSIQAENGDAEGFGMVLLEAQAAGVPVVTSALGGADEGLLEGVTGFRVSPADVNILAERLTTMLTEDRLAQTMAVKARRFTVDRFDIAMCTANLTRLYDKVTQTVATEDS